MNWSWLVAFFTAFAIMEFNAWFLHKYVMHGPLWILHKDHHQPVAGRWYQWNDAFAIFFAVPSFLFILADSLYRLPRLGAVGFGIMAYGAVYSLVHEGVIHRRLKFVPVMRGFYFEALNAAHKVHHAVREKEGAANFGMLVVPWKYYVAALQRRRAVSDIQR